MYADTQILTPREKEIVLLIAEGCSNKEAAEELGVSVFTVRGHVQHAFAKTGVRSRIELAMFAARAGWISLSIPSTG